MQHKRPPGISFPTLNVHVVMEEVGAFAVRPREPPNFFVIGSRLDRLEQGSTAL